MQERQAAKKICSRIGLALAIASIALTVAAIIFSILVELLPKAIQTHPAMVWLGTDIPLYLVAFPIFWLIIRNLPEIPKPARQKAKIGPFKFLFLAIFVLGAMYGVSMATGILMDYVKAVLGRTGNINVLSDAAGESSLLMTFIFGAIVPPLGEEFIFRYLIRRKMRGAGDKVFIIFSGVLFGLFHMNIDQFFYATALGLVFAWVYVQTDNIWYSIGLHFVTNSFGMVLLPTLVELLPEDSNGVLLLGLGIMVAVLIAAVSFLISLPRVIRGLHPPTQPGWVSLRSASTGYVAPGGYHPAPSQTFVPGQAVPGYPASASFGAPGGYPAPPQTFVPGQAVPAYPASANFGAPGGYPASQQTFVPGQTAPTYPAIPDMGYATPPATGVEAAPPTGQQPPAQVPTPYGAAPPMAAYPYPAAGAYPAEQYRAASPPAPIYGKGKLSVAFLNAGVIFYILLCLANIVLTFFVMTKPV